MKKIIILFILISNIAFTQGSGEINPIGTTPIIRSTGFGTAPAGLFINNKISISGYTGSTTSATGMTGVLGYAANSSLRNWGIHGFADGISQENIGVLGQANLQNGTAYAVKGILNSSSIGADLLYGGSFVVASNPGINGSAVAYGVVGSSAGLGAVSSSYGLAGFSNASTTTASFGVFGESSSGGTGNEFGGSFVARGSGIGIIKTGVQAQSSGTASVSLRYGLNASSTGPASTESYGVNGLADNSGSGRTYGGYFKAQGSGAGSKWGIYATTAGSGSQYAAALIGKVGINTEVPTEALTVLTTTNTNGITHSDGTISVSTWVGTGAGWYGTKSNHPLYFFTNNGNSQATLLTNGNFGIGITTPIEKLHVAGNQRTTGTIFTSNLNATGTATIVDANISANLTVGNLTSTDLLNVGGGTKLSYIKRVVLTGQQIFGVVNNTCDLNYYSVSGAVPGDNVVLNIESSFSTLTVANVRVSANDQVEVKFCNIGTSNTLLQNNLTFRFMIYR